MCDIESKGAIEKLLDGDIDEYTFIKNFNGNCYVPSFRSNLDMAIRIKKGVLNKLFKKIKNSE